MGYMHIDNLYKNQTILQFRECYAMEKIHGTSAHISWRDGKVTLSSGGEKADRFAVFDVLWENRANGERRYLDWDDLKRFCAQHSLPVVPELYRGPWRKDLVSLAEGPSTMPGAKHCREGFVVRPLVERRDPHFGRVQLKLHGEGYLTRKEAA